MIAVSYTHLTLPTKRIGLKEVNALIESSISDFSHGRDKLKRALSILSEE